MADISQYLQAIMSAVYGEDVRGSIHDAIALINDVGEAVLTLGTAVDSPTSPTTGFYQDSVYLNTATGDMWTCTGTGWSLSGNTRGAQGDPGIAATIDVGTVTSGAVASVTNSGTTSAAVFDFVLPKGDKGDTGDGLTAESEHSGSNTIVSIKNTTTQTVVDTFNVPDGSPGATGNGIASIAKTATAGLVDTYTITYTDGTSTTFTVTNGQDGSGAGDMTKAAYDPTNAVSDAGGIPAYVSAHAGTTYTGEKGVVVAGTTIKAALVNDSASSLASETISVSANRQYAVNLDSNSKLSVNVPWVNTTYNDATTLASGLMSASDKTKLNGLDEVVANPAGTPTDDLSSIQIGSTVYRLQGGGGTTIVQIPSVSGTSFVYDGTAQGAAITGLDTTHCTVVPGTGTTVTTVGSTTYVKATNAGSYDFTIELNDPSSMVWSDLTVADKTYAFAIAKAPQTITASKNSVSLTVQQPSDTVTISGQITSLNVSSSPSGVVTTSESSGVVTITGASNGNTTISVYAEETTNYSQSNTVNISASVLLATVYGVTWDGTSTSAWTRTDDAALFTDPVPAVNNGNGSSPFDSIAPWSGMVVSERTGGTMVAIPKYYFKLTKTGSAMSIKITDGANKTWALANGYQISPAHMDRGDGAGERDVVYVGAYHCSSGDYKSTTGVLPKVSASRSVFRSNIHNIGSNIWQWDKAIQETIQLLYLVEFADWNSQKKIGYGGSAGNPAGTVTNTGACDSMTYHTGTNASSRTTYGHVRYRYIEDLWSNVRDWLDGVYIASGKAYFIKNPADFSDSSGGTYDGFSDHLTGNEIKSFGISETSGYTWVFFPSETVSNSNYDTYVCDRAVVEGTDKVIHVGGNYITQEMGLFSMGTWAEAGTNAYIGSRLMELP